MQGRPVAILVARSAIAAIPVAEMQALVDLVMAQGTLASAHLAFSEQGEPTLRHQCKAVVDAGASAIIIVPVMLPMEPSFAAWLTRSLARWEHEDGRAWPPIRVAPSLSQLPFMGNLLASAVNAALDRPAETRPVKMPGPQGSVVPAQKRRVLVCHGGPCTAAGAPLIWGHLRNEQARLSLRTEGDGMMSAKSTCLGPCNLAPVVQVCPENSYYGGVDEKAVDRIIHAHLLGGVVAEEYAYAADGKKKFLHEAP
ncbi:MAG TPA: (2Fe-2S) ferredoxin domain-containing protein [Sphingobium sp.]|nr:(2Fe-2S) ferredoxin domain-containing protein [Sphingobium sp.]